MSAPSAPSLYLAAYLAAVGEPGWAPDADPAATRITRGGEAIQWVQRIGGWVCREAPERHRDLRPFGGGHFHRPDPPVVIPVSPDLARLAMGRTQYPALSRPSFVGACAVEANVYPGGFDRLAGCLAAAVYRVPGRRYPSPEPDTLQLVACWRLADGVGWTVAMLGEAP